MRSSSSPTLLPTSSKQLDLSTLLPVVFGLKCKFMSVWKLNKAQRKWLWRTLGGQFSNLRVLRISAFAPCPLALDELHAIVRLEKGSVALRQLRVLHLHDIPALDDDAMGVLAGAGCGARLQELSLECCVIFPPSLSLLTFFFPFLLFLSRSSFSFSSSLSSFFSLSFIFSLLFLLLHLAFLFFFLASCSTSSWRSSWNTPTQPCTP